MDGSLEAIGGVLFSEEAAGIRPSERVSYALRHALTMVA